jgi:putative transposase
VAAPSLLPKQMGSLASQDRLGLDGVPGLRRPIAHDYPAGAVVWVKLSLVVIAQRPKQQEAIRRKGLYKNPDVYYISRIMSRAPRQLSFHLRTHGGRRVHAGRKPKGKKALVSHAARPRFDKVMPAHVTLRVRDDVPSLRSSKRFARIREVFAAARQRFGLRIIDFSVLGNHLHFIVEADGSASLSRGMQGLNIRLAKALNMLLSREGRVFADHYHARLLRSPTELATSIGYVLENAEHHYGDSGIDPCSSSARDAIDAVTDPQGWLLCFGWRRSRKKPPAVWRFASGR